MKRSLPQQKQTQDFESLTRIKTYIKNEEYSSTDKRRIKGRGIQLTASFSNRALTFNTTNRKTAYEYCISFTEEMHDEYNTEPLSEYNIYN